jgi:hypothetical protein
MTDYARQIDRDGQSLRIPTGFETIAARNRGPEQQTTHMAGKQDNDSSAKEKKEPKIEVRDLKPKKEVNGGTQNAGRSGKRPPAKTGEIDFMNWD